MEQTGVGPFETFCERLRQEIAPYAGLVEYGNLRHQISVWETAQGGRITNLALVYETPGGSTDQINISYDHETGQFSLIEDAEHTTEDIADVLTRIMPRVSTIPEKRRESLFAEIERQIAGGVNRAGLFVHINRLMQSDFKGGTITHQELQEAMRHAVKLMNQKSNGNGM